MTFYRYETRASYSPKWKRSEWKFDTAREARIEADREARYWGYETCIIRVDETVIE